MINYLKGSKGGKSSGGGGGGSAPSITNTPDNLRSKDTVEVILALSEGPIFGLKEGAKSFYIGDTPLQNQNGDFNFKSFQLSFYSGQEDAQAVTPVLGGVSSNQAVNVELATNVSVTRQTQTPNIDFIDVRILFNRLMRSNNEGTFQHTVRFKIEYKESTSGTWLSSFGGELSITGKTTSTYAKDFRISVPKIAGSYDVRVTKLSDDGNGTEYFTDIVWESYQETIAGAMAFNNTAVLQLVGEGTDQFSSIPQWSGVYLGMLIKIPSNYNPTTRTYTGVWDGGFNVAYSNNPAWCLYDFIMNDRYGMKSYYPEILLDKYDVYEAGRWCDELVPNGRGGTQPRYTFNANISEARTGKELARYIAGSFNATFYDDLNGVAYLRVDKDDDACNIFTRENIYEDGFEYSYTDLTSRYNDITVTFKNPDLNWAEDRRRVYDDALIAKNGRIPLDFIAVGTIDQHEAIRKAHYKMITANTETCMVKFRTNRLGQFVNPFDTILVCDPDMGYGVSGRVKEFTNDGGTVILRDPIYLEAGISYDVEFVLSNGQRHRTGVQSTVKGYNSQFNISAPVDMDLIPERTVFTLEHPTLIGLPRPFRVMKVEEVDGDPDQMLIEAININRNKWYDADNVTDSGTLDYSVLPNPFDPPPPISVGFEERYVKNKKEFQTTISPFFDRGAYKYYANDHSFEVWTRLTGSTDNYQKRDIYFGDTLINHPPGSHDVKVLGKSYLGFSTRLDAARPYLVNFTNPKDPPNDLDWIKINRSEVYWGYINPPEDFAGYILKYHNVENRTTWNDAIQPHRGLISTTNFYTNLIPPSARVIMVRAVDDFGVESNSAIIYRPLGNITGNNIIERYDYHDAAFSSPIWGGTLEGCSVEGGVLKANDTGTNLYSGTPDAEIYDGGNFYESTYEQMFYYDFFTVGASGGEMLINIVFEGSGYEVNIRPVESPVAPWQPISERLALEPGDYEVRLRVYGGPLRGSVEEFSVIIDAPSIDEDIEDLVIPSSGEIRVPITKTYSAIKIVNVIIQDNGGSDAVAAHILDKNPTLGPLIRLLDQNLNPVDGLVDVQIKGY